MQVQYIGRQSNSKEVVEIPDQEDNGWIQEIPKYPLLKMNIIIDNQDLVFISYKEVSNHYGIALEGKNIYVNKYFVSFLKKLNKYYYFTIFLADNIKLHKNKIIQFFNKQMGQDFGFEKSFFLQFSQFKSETKSIFQFGLSKDKTYILANSKSQWEELQRIVPPVNFMISQKNLSLSLIHHNQKHIYNFSQQAIFKFKFHTTLPISLYKKAALQRINIQKLYKQILKNQILHCYFQQQSKTIDFYNQIFQILGGSLTKKIEQSTLYVYLTRKLITFKRVISLKSIIIGMLQGRL